MVIRWLACGLTMLVLGCGPDVDRTELAPLCGQTGPVQILELAENEIVDASRNGLVPRDGGFLAAVREFEAPVTDVLVTSQRPPDLRKLAQTSARLVWIDGCGGEPVPIADGIDHIAGPSPTEGLWLGCRQDTRELFSFDPRGQAALSRLGPAGCDTAQSSGFVLALVRVAGESDGDLVRIGLHEQEPPEIVVLASDVASWQAEGNGDVAPGTVLAATSSRELWEIDVASGSRELLRDEVSSFFGVRDSRFIMMSHDGKPSQYGSPGRYSVIDRSSGTITELGIPGMSISIALMGPDAINAWEHPGPGFASRTQLTFLPSMESLVLDGSWFGIGVTPDGKRLLGRSGDEAGIFTLEPGGTEPRLVSDRISNNARIAADAVVFDAPLLDAVPDTRYEPHLREYLETMIRIPFSTFEPEVLVDEVYDPLPVDDGRWVNVAGFAGDLHGDLEVIDPETGRRELIDGDVYKSISSYNGGPTYDAPSNGDIVYAVRDGDRTGLWRVRLAD